MNNDLFIIKCKKVIAERNREVRTPRLTRWGTEIRVNAPLRSATGEAQRNAEARAIAEKLHEKFDDIIDLKGARERAK